MHYKKGKLAWFLVPHIFLQSVAFSETPPDENKSQENPKSETVVEGQRPITNDAKFTYLKDKSADQMPGDAAMLFHIPGLTLTQSGGPLATSEIRYRGLSSARFLVDLEGLTLNNPTTGFSDANAMFLFAAKNLQTNAQSLSITLPTIDYPQAKGIVGYGSQHATKLGASAGTVFDDFSSIFVAFQGTTTNGRFSFSSPDLAADSSNNFYRENNDQHRLQAVAKYQRKTPIYATHALFAFNAHEGGIAGFALSPTVNLRSQAIYSGFKAGYSRKIRKAEFSFDVANSLFDYTTTDEPKNDEQLLASTHEFTFGYKPLSLPSWMDIEFANQLVIERAYQLDKTRIGAGFLMKRTMTGRGSLKPKTFATFSMLGFHGEGLIFKKDFGFSIEPASFMSLTGRFMRQQRLPTFMEMYANNRFFLGNEDLKKESVWDLEVGTNIRFGARAHMQVTAFMGYLSNAIVYVPFFGTRLRPINADSSAKRHGIDVSFSYEPLDWLAFETKNSLLRTRHKSTNSPLPQSPAFLGFTKIRIGKEEIVSLAVSSRYRTSSTAKMFGTLRSPGYALFDAILSTRFLKELGMSVSVSNIFNVKTARDTYEIPLPGTVVFGQIEVGNVS